MSKSRKIKKKQGIRKKTVRKRMRLNGGTIHKRLERVMSFETPSNEAYSFRYPTSKSMFGVPFSKLNEAQLKKLEKARFYYADPDHIIEEDIEQEKLDYEELMRVVRNELMRQQEEEEKGKEEETTQETTEETTQETTEETTQENEEENQEEIEANKQEREKNKYENLTESDHFKYESVKHEEDMFPATGDYKRMTKEMRINLLKPLYKKIDLIKDLISEHGAELAKDLYKTHTASKNYFLNTANHGGKIYTRKRKIYRYNRKPRKDKNW
jgi:hypothetical protein